MRMSCTISQGYLVLYGKKLLTYFDFLAVIDPTVSPWPIWCTCQAGICLTSLLSGQPCRQPQLTWNIMGMSCTIGQGYLVLYGKKLLVYF